MKINTKVAGGAKQQDALRPMIQDIPIVSHKFFFVGSNSLFSHTHFSRYVSLHLATGLTGGELNQKY